VQTARAKLLVFIYAAMLAGSPVGSMPISCAQ